MPLPWLIGAAVLGIGAAIASAVSDDDSSRKSTDNEERLRADAAKKRAEREREQKREIALTLFQERGEKMAADLTSSLDDWVQVSFRTSPVFDVELSASGYSRPSASDCDIDRMVAGLLSDCFIDRYKSFRPIKDNLCLFSKLYDARLKSDKKLRKSVAELNAIEEDLATIKKLRRELRRFQGTKVDHA